MPTDRRSIYDWLLVEGVAPVLAAWEQFKPFFEEHGYKLYVSGSDDDLHVTASPECSPTRAEDEYGRFLPEWLDTKRHHSCFYPQSGIHMAAVSPDNTDVVIRIMAIGDEGLEHLTIMRALAAPEAQAPENHTLPMIGELSKDDIVFGIFPFAWARASEYPWFETVRQLLELLEQVLEGLDFLHQRLIAHRDFDLAEVFSNYGRGYDPTKKRPPCRRRPSVFRSLCTDIRYLINDFELSVAFAPDSDPASRVVTGLPTARYGLTPDTYFKWLPPEALLEAPYCPFKADIYQFGKSALFHYQNVCNPPELLELLSRMASDDSGLRPTAGDALATVRNLIQNTPQDVLEDVPTHRSFPFRRFAHGEVWCVLSCSIHKKPVGATESSASDCSVCTRQAATAASYDSDMLNLGVPETISAA